MIPRDDAQPPARASTRRWRRLGLNAGALIVGRIVAGLCQFALVPLLLSQLGTEVFGWAMALVAIVALSQFADLGVAMALQHELSLASARGDPAGVRRIYASGARLLRWLGAGWFFAAAPLAWWLGPRALAAPGGVGGLESPFSWLLVTVAACVGVPLAAGPRLAAALQLGWLHAAWTAVVGVGTLAAAWAASRIDGSGPVIFVALLCLSQIAPGFLTAVHLSHRLQWRGDVAADPAEVRRLWHAGRQFAAPNLAGALLQALTPSLFARFGGYETSAAFAVLQRLFGTVQQGHALLLAPLWPAFTEAAERGEHAWVRHSFRLSLALTALAAAVIAIATFALPSIFSLWLGPRATTPTAWFAWMLAGWTIAGMAAQALSLFLLGLGRLQRIALPIACVHGVTLGGLAFFGAKFGGAGVAAALVAGSLFGLLPVLARACTTALRSLTEKGSTPTPGPANL